MFWLEKYYCENGKPGLPDGQSADSIEWTRLELIAARQGDENEMVSIAKRREQALDAGHHLLVANGFFGDRLGTPFVTGTADEHGGCQVRVGDKIHSVAAVCYICGAPIRRLP